MSLEGYTQEQIGYHMLLMMEGGLVEGIESTTHGGPPEAIALRLKWAGHEFIEASREPTRWERTKTLMAKAGGASFPVWMEVLTKAATTSLGPSMTGDPLAFENWFQGGFHCENSLTNYR